MYLYLIARTDDVGHDEVRSVVVAAPTAALARQAARDIKEGDQSPEVWAPATATLNRLGTADRKVRAGVIHMDMHHG